MDIYAQYPLVNRLQCAVLYYLMVCRQVQIAWNYWHWLVTQWRRMLCGFAYTTGATFRFISELHKLCWAELLCNW